MSCPSFCFSVALTSIVGQYTEAAIGQRLLRSLHGIAERGVQHDAQP
jgi:hypothetical protein